MEPQVTIHRYFSRQAKYAGYADADLELIVQRYAGDVVRMELLNRQHGVQLRRQLRRLLLLLALSVAYFAGVCGLSQRSLGLWQPRILYPLATCLSAALLMLRSTLGLVETERLFYSWDLALQTETVRSFGRERVQCVERGNIHDVVLNEVIENLDVKYMLILRTKGSLFKKRPIVPLFNSQSPSFECLQHIYKILHGYWLNNSDSKALSEKNYSMDSPLVVAS